MKQLVVIVVGCAIMAGSALAQESGRGFPAEVPVAMEIHADDQLVSLEYWPDARSCGYSLAAAVNRVRNQYPAAILKGQCSRNGIPIEGSRIDWPPGGAPARGVGALEPSSGAFSDDISPATRQRVDRLLKQLQRDLTNLSTGSAVVKAPDADLSPVVTIPAGTRMGGTYEGFRLTAPISTEQTIPTVAQLEDAAGNKVEVPLLFHLVPAR